MRSVKYDEVRQYGPAHDDANCGAMSDREAFSAVNTPSKFSQLVKISQVA